VNDESVAKNLCYDQTGMVLARAAAFAALGIAMVACSQPADAPLTLLTVNIANGAGNFYRTSDTRAAQAAFVARSGATIVGMEEVDIGVDRSAHADTGDEVLALPCTVAQPPYTADGVRRCESAAGSYVFALSVRGDDTYRIVDGLPVGIEAGTSTDRSHDAVFGVAVGVRHLAVTDAYAVMLPNTVDQPPDEALFAALGAGGPDAPARAQLAERNLSLRTLPGLPPRVALVVRLDHPGGVPLSVIETHLEIADIPGMGGNQLTSVLAMVRAERAGPPARQVVVMGDFNQATFGRAQSLLDAGLRRALDPPTSVGSVLDQIWVDTDLLLLRTGELSTGGVSDHPVAVRTTIQ
jgi:Endonuclease/Exonuclease/phosphatase family